MVALPEVSILVRTRLVQLRRYNIHIDAVVGDANDSSENHRTHPVNWWATTSPCEADETERQAGSCPQKPPKSGLVLRLLIIGVSLTVFLVSPDGGNEREI